MDFYRVDIPGDVLRSVTLSVETRELGVAGGFQDRVIQVYDGLVYMDLAREKMRDRFGYSCGAYEPLDPQLLPPLYLAYSTLDSEPTEVFHNNLRARFDGGDPQVVSAMQRFAELAVEAKEALLAQDPDRFARAMDENFDTRQRIRRLNPSHVEMIERARQVGASAKFAGSGGAIVGTYRDEAMFDRLKQQLAQIRCQVVKPVIHESLADPHR